MGCGRSLPNEDVGKLKNNIDTTINISKHFKSLANKCIERSISNSQTSDVETEIVHRFRQLDTIGLNNKRILLTYLRPGKPAKEELKKQIDFIEQHTKCYEIISQLKEKISQTEERLKIRSKEHAELKYEDQQKNRRIIKLEEENRQLRNKLTDLEKSYQAGNESFNAQTTLIVDLKQQLLDCNKQISQSKLENDVSEYKQISHQNVYQHNLQYFEGLANQQSGRDENFAVQTIQGLQHSQLEQHPKKQDKYVEQIEQIKKQILEKDEDARIKEYILSSQSKLVDNLKDNLSVSNKEVQELKSENQNLYGELNKFLRLIKQYESQIQKLQLQLSPQENHHLQKNFPCKQEDDDVGNRETCAEFQRKLEELQHENNFLQSRLENQNKVSSENQKLSLENVKYKSEALNLQQQLLQKTNDLVKLELQIDDLQESLNIGNLESLQQENQGLKWQLSEQNCYYKKLAEKYFQENQDLLQKVEQLLSNSEIQSENLEAFEQLKLQSFKYKSQIQEFEETTTQQQISLINCFSKIENLEESLVYFQKDFQEAKQDNDNLTKQLVRFTTLERNYNAKQELCKSRQEAIEELEKRLAIATNEISKLQLRNETLEKELQHTKQQTNAAVGDASKSNDNEIKDPYVRKSLEKIDAIRKDTERIQRAIREFSGTKEDKDYLHLNEMLIRNVVKLDNVESEGHAIIRQKRKEVIRYVQQQMDSLKEKV